MFYQTDKNSNEDSLARTKMIYIKIPFIQYYHHSTIKFPLLKRHKKKIFNISGC